MMLILFILALFTATLSLTAALALWCAGITHAVVLSLVGVGLIYLVLSLLIYKLSLHKTFTGWRQRLDTIYEVSATIEGIARQAIGFVKKIVG